MSASDAREGWLMDCRQRRLSPRTVDRYEDVVGAFLETLGTEATVEDLDSASRRPQDHPLAKYSMVLAQTHNPETLRRELGNVKTFGHWLEFQGIVDVDPFRRVVKPKTDSPERRVIRAEDAQRLFDTFDMTDRTQVRDYALVQLVLDTGLRISEVCDAKLADLNLQEGWLQVWGKGRKQRRVPLSPSVKMLLWKWVRTDRKRWAKTDFLFVSHLGGPLDRHRVSGRFRAKVQSLGLGYRVRFHDLRHAAATYMLRAGMPKERVSRVLGHANDSITSIYEHLDFEDVQDSYAGHNPLDYLRK
jgi:site-specific recombinase XerD